MFFAKRFVTGNVMAQLRKQTRTIGSTVTLKKYRQERVLKSTIGFYDGTEYRETKPMKTQSRNISHCFNFNFNDRRFRLRPLHKAVRCTSTAIPVVSYPCMEQIRKTFMTDRYRSFIEAINLDTRIRVSVDEFNRIAQEFGFKAEEAADVRAKLSEVGVILDHSAAHKMVIIKPERVIKLWEESLNLNLSYKSKFLNDKKMELEGYREELKPLQEQADKIEGEAQRWADRCMGGLFAYAVSYSAVITYFIFWLLSWDIMEPATYICGLLNLLLAILFFNRTNAEFTFQSMRDALVNIRKKQLYKKQKFDELMYNRILQLINEAEADLHNPEWFILNEISNEMSGVKLPDPVKFTQEHTHFSN